MNTQQAAEMLLTWKKMKDQLNYMEGELKKFVLENKSDLVAGDVVAKYNSPKKFRDYKLAVEEIPALMNLLVEKYLKIDFIDSKVYKMVCEEMKVDAPIGKETPATVTLK